MKNLQIIALACAALGMAFLTSCATTRGFGQDLQKVGNRLENEADATGGAEPDRSTAPVTPSAY